MKRWTSELYTLDPSCRVDVSLHDHQTPEDQGLKLFEAIQSDLFLIRLQQIAWSVYRDKVGGPNGSKGDNVNDVAKLLSDTGLREIVANTAVRMYEKSNNLRSKSAYDTSSVRARTSKDEQIDYIRRIRVEWEQGIQEELMVIAQEQARPFAMMRAPGKFKEFLETGDSSVLRNGVEESVKFLFDSEDLLETATSIRNPNMKPEAVNKILGLIKVSLKTPTLEDFTNRYRELAVGLSQLGFDERHVSMGTKFCFQRHEEGEALAFFGTSMEARKYMRRGVSPSLRSKLWRAALTLPPDVTQDEMKRLKVLRSYCEHLDVITDRLFMFDVDNVVDDPRFFVFEEEVQETIMCFSRDDWVRNNAAYEVHLPMLSLVDPAVAGATLPNSSSASSLASAGVDSAEPGASSSAAGGDAGTVGAALAGNDSKKKPSTSLSADPLRLPSAGLKDGGRGGGVVEMGDGEMGGVDKQVTVPTSGVQPFLGLAIYAAPLCYVFRDRAALYSAHKILWCRLWSKMNVISSDEGTLVHVCATFENLLMSSHPTLVLHMVRIGVQPLLIAMPWLQFGFVGLLEVDQILHLWDRVIGYDDTCLLALVAVGVFLIRAENILATQAPAEVCSILMEGTRLRVVPILQMMLFSDSERK